MSKRSPSASLNLRAVENRTPLQCVFEITYNCNLRCVHCYLSKRNGRKELSLPSIFKIIDQLVDIGCLWLVLSGGEIFTHRHIFSIAEYARQKNFNLILLTNGTLVTKKIAHRLKVLKPSVDISLYGFRKTHDKITQTPGSFDATILGIRRLVEKGIRVSTKAVIMKGNIHEVREVRAYAKTLGANTEISPDGLLISPRVDGNRQPLRYRVSDEDLKKYYKKYAEDLKATGKKFKVFVAKDTYKLCGAGFTNCSITPYGELNPCIEIQLRDNKLSEKPFKEIWNNNTEMQALRNLTIGDKKECNRCNLAGYCFRCPGISLLEQGSLVAKIPEACRLAKIQSRIFGRYNLYKRVRFE